MNFPRSFTTDVSFQGMPPVSCIPRNVSPMSSVGPVCHLCTRLGPTISLDEFTSTFRCDQATCRKVRGAGALTDSARHVCAQDGLRVLRLRFRAPRGEYRA